MWDYIYIKNINLLNKKTNMYRIAKNAIAVSHLPQAAPRAHPVAFGVSQGTYVIKLNKQMFYCSNARKIKPRRKFVCAQAEAADQATRERFERCCQGHHLTLFVVLT